jgi:hypothetical protein
MDGWMDGWMHHTITITQNQTLGIWARAGQSLMVSH